MAMKGYGQFGVYFGYIVNRTCSQWDEGETEKPGFLSFWLEQQGG